MGCGVDKALWSWGVAFTPSLWTNLPTFVAELHTWCPRRTGTSEHLTGILVLVRIISFLYFNSLLNLLIYVAPAAVDQIKNMAVT